jgi:hypothetical protein
MLVLPPSIQVQQVCYRHAALEDLSQTVADQAALGGIVNVGPYDERVGPRRPGSLGNQLVPLGNNQVIDPLDRLGADK